MEMKDRAIYGGKIKIKIDNQNQKRFGLLGFEDHNKPSTKTLGKVYLHIV